MSAVCLHFTHGFNFIQPEDYIMLNSNLYTVQENVSSVAGMIHAFRHGMRKDNIETQRIKEYNAKFNRVIAP